MPNIFHITHVDNLPSIMQVGLVCDSHATRDGRTRVDIGYSQIRGRRALREVPYEPGGNLNDYVPFYFGPRSPMLYAIQRGRVEQYQDGQGRIIHLVTSTEAIDGEELLYVYTDGHAVIELSDFFTDLDEIDEHVDFTLMQARYWYDTDEQPDRKRKRQAEFLVYESLPWEMIEGIGVISEAMQSEVEELMEGSEHVPPVYVRPEWYY